MSKWRRLKQKQRILDFKDTISESYLCIDCGFDTHPESGEPESHIYRDIAIIRKQLGIKQQTNREA
jgi:hypothetical protein